MSNSITKPGSGYPVPLDLRRHRRKCLVCNHPEREAIEEFFLHWHEPSVLETRFHVPKISIYRHAHALGLYARRAANLRPALELIIERAGFVRVTGDTVIRAIRAYACLSEDGRWAEPASRVVFSVARPAPHYAPAPPQPVPASAPDHSPNPREIAPQPERFLIDTPTIKNDPNSLETQEATPL
jgi:hypothetical protein